MRFVALGSPEANETLAHLSWEEQFESSHIVGPDGVVESAGASALTLFSLLPLTAPFVWLFRLLPGHRSLAERGYKWVADNRYKFTPNATCGMKKPSELG